MSKTIYITSFHPLISRNIIGSPFLDILISNGFKLIVLYPKKKKSFFEAEYGSKDIILEGIDTSLSIRDKILRIISLSALHTRSMRIKRKTELKGIVSILSLFLRGQFGSFVVRNLSLILTPSKTFERVFKKYGPGIILLTDIQNESDIGFGKAARKNGQRILGMTRSWDNLSSKGLIRFFPDIFIVQNQILKKEAIGVHNVPEEIIKVIGIPHYDRYVSSNYEKKEIFAELNIPANKKVVLFAPAGDRYISDNTVDSDILMIMDKNLDERYFIIVRLPPNDNVKTIESGTFSNRVVIDRPSQRFKVLKNTELSPEDDIKLIKLLISSDVVVSGPSTMIIDAAIVGRPSVIFSFDGSEKRSYYSSVRRFYDYNHFNPVVESNACYIAKSPKELINFINKAVANPFEKEKERNDLIDKECFKKDGGSSQRLLEIILREYER